MRFELTTAFVTLLSLSGVVAAPYLTFYQGAFRAESIPKAARAETEDGIDP